MGNVAELGGWDPASAVALSADNYPTWSGDVSLPDSTTVEYKYIKKDGGNVTWMSGGNLSLTTPCNGTLSTMILGNNVNQPSRGLHDGLTLSKG